MGEKSKPVCVDRSSLDRLTMQAPATDASDQRTQEAALPSGPCDSFRLEYWLPDARLSNYITGYHLYEINGEPGERFTDVIFPAWANIRVTLAGEPWSVRLGRRTFFPEESSIFGATSHAGYVDFGNGSVVGFGVTPIGWARLFKGNAQEFANKVSPLEQLLGAEMTTLTTPLLAGGHPPEMFDRWLLERLLRSEPGPESIQSLFELIADPEIATVATLAERTGLSERRLIRLSQRHFGFGPKSLLRRSRFLRALMNIQALKRGNWARAAADAGYHDQSHFLRDCHLFLDMSLSDFLRFPKPMAEASFRLRTKVHGAPVQGLHTISAEDEIGVADKGRPRPAPGKL